MNTYRIEIFKDGEPMDLINLIDGDSFVFEAPIGITAMGKHAVLQWKLNRADEVIKRLRERIRVRDTTSLENASVDQILEELKLRTESSF